MADSEILQERERRRRRHPSLGEGLTHELHANFGDSEKICAPDPNISSVAPSCIPVDYRFVSPCLPPQVKDARPSAIEYENVSAQLPEV